MKRILIATAICAGLSLSWLISCAILSAQSFKIGPSWRDGGNEFFGFFPLTLLSCSALNTECQPMAPFLAFGNALQYGLTFDPYPSSTTNTKNNFIGGYADPSIRCDPNTITAGVCGKMWIAYSAPWGVAQTSQVGGCSSTTFTGNQTVSTHIAYSTDQGAHWSNSGLPNPTGQGAGIYFFSQPVCNPDSNHTNWSNNEVPNIYPINSGGNTYWVIITQYYEKDGADNFIESTRRYHIRIVEDLTGSNGPLATTNALDYYACGSATHTASYSCFNLESTSPANLAACGTVFIEPSWIVSGGNLILNTFCADMSLAAQFSTTLGTPPTSTTFNTWNYDGSFAVPADAVNVSAFVGASGITGLHMTQMDMFQCESFTQTCTIESVVTNSGNKVNFGYVVTPLATVNPPTFSRTAGNINVLATLTCSDCGTLGPGSATYDPYGTAAGPIFGHKHNGCPVGTHGCAQFTLYFQYLMFTPPLWATIK